MEDTIIKTTVRENLQIELKEYQLQAITSYAYRNKDTFFIAPTGYGKSIVYQAAPFLFAKDKYAATTTTTSRRRRATKPATSTAASESQSVRGDTLSSVTSLTLFTTSTPTTRPQQRHNNKSSEDSVDELSRLLERSTLLSSSSIDDDSVFQQGAQEEGTEPRKALDQVQFLIIVPLLTIIHDAISTLRSRMPQVSAIHLTAATLEEAESACFLFCIPEFILSTVVGRNFLQTKAKIRAVSIDEFHIVDAWGLTEERKRAFREAFGQLGELRAFLKNVPFICMSATASSDVIATVSKSLRISSANIIKVQINKPNITYHIIKGHGSVIEDFNWLIDLIRQKTVPRMLVFFNNINTLSDAYAYVIYHAGLHVGDASATVVMYNSLTNDPLRPRILTDMADKKGSIRVVFCTSTLSMGVNMASVEYVIHYGPPSSVSAFFQETGRAAREPDAHAHSILLVYPRMSAGRKLDRAMKAYVSIETKCLREVILREFDTRKPVNQPNCCMRCNPEVICALRDRIVESYTSSATETFSDNDSVASVGSVESL